MLNYQFSNLCGVIHSTGSLSFINDTSDILLSPVGNKLIILDLKHGTSSTLPIESRSDISAIEISNDGHILILVDIEGYCLIVNFPKQIVIGHFNFRAKVSCLKISPNNSFVAVCLNKSIKIFEMPRVLLEEYEPFVLYKHYTSWQNDKITCLTWSNDSRFVLTGSKDTTVRLLNVFKIKGYVPIMFSGHKKKVINCVFSQDMKRIYSISQDGVMFVWKYIEEQSEEYKRASRFERTVKGNKNLKSKYEIELKNEIKADNDIEDENDDDDEDEGIEDIIKDYSPFEIMIMKGRFILEKKQQFMTNAKVVLCRINIVTNILVLGLQSGEFGIYDMNSFENKYTLKISNSKITSLCINQQGTLIAFGNKNEGQLLVWEWKSESYIFNQEGHFYNITTIGYSPDSSQIASGDSEGRIKIWDVSNSSCIKTFTDHTGKVTEIKYALNKSNVFVSSSLDGTVNAYDLVTYKNFRKMTTAKPCQFTSVAIDFSGEIICAGARDPYSIYVWSIKNGDLIDVLSGHTAPISSLSFSLVRDLLVSGSWDNTVKLWELYSKKGTSETYEHNSKVLSVALSPDDKEVAVSTLNGELYTWDISTGSTKNVIDVSREIWGGRLKEERVSAKNSKRNKHLNTICYNLSGNLLICGGNSQYVLIYDMIYQILVKKFCLTHNLSVNGLLHKLNSSKRDKEIEYDSEDEINRNKIKKKALPGQINQNDPKNVEISISNVKFSNTNRSWAVATTEGIYIYSLDKSLTFNKLTLDINITPQDAIDSFVSGSFLKGIIYSFYLNSTDIVSKYLKTIPHTHISLISTKLPFNVIGPFLDYLCIQMEKEMNIEMTMMWMLNLIKSNGDKFKALKNKSIFLNIHKALQKNFLGIENIVNENIYSIKYLTENEGEREREDESTLD